MPKVNSKGETREEALARVSKQMYSETSEMLERKHKCIVLRPTGLGKTFMMAHMTRRFKKTLFLYPFASTLDIQTKYKDVLKDTTFMSYMRLIRHTDEELQLLANTYQCVMMDEVHLCGATRTRDAVKKLMKFGKSAYFLGATATPDRSDGFNVVAELFDNTTISEYTVHDAIQDGILRNPLYVYSLIYREGMLNELKNRVMSCESTTMRERLMGDLGAATVEMSKILTAPDNIKNTILEKFKKEPKYMKFIMFFSEKAALKEKLSEVQGWFNTAFPDKELRTLIITSDTEYKNNVSKLVKMKRDSGCIDLILCINMLNMGYHIPNLTGVIMLRGTASNIIFKQQVGRCMSVDSLRQIIIFDFVNNLFAKPYYETSRPKAGDTQDGKPVEKDTLGSRLNRLDKLDLVVENKTAHYEELITKLMQDLDSVELDKYLNWYLYHQMPYKDLLKFSGMSDDYMRNEFKRRGIEFVA